jgi:hypothetical protein
VTPIAHARCSRLALFCRANRPSNVGHAGSSAFRLSTITVSMSLTGSCFSSESAPGPFHHGIRDEVEQSLPRPYRDGTAGRGRPLESTEHRAGQLTAGEGVAESIATQQSSAAVHISVLRKCPT